MPISANETGWWQVSWFSSFKNSKKEILRMLFLEHKVKNDLKKITEELDEHLESINDNTNELQSNYEYLCQLDLKVEKLSEIAEENRLLLMELLDRTNVKIDEEKLRKVSLGTMEQAIFLLLYTEAQPLTYKELARKLGSSESLISSYVTNLVEKGIPLAKRYVNKTVCVELENDFREEQTKKGLIKISQATIKQYI